MTEAMHRVWVGDARQMAELPGNAVHLVVTSPPYWQLKDYGAPGQIGFDDTYADYINHLNLVWCEVARVLHPGCRLCINIGDQFARAATYGRYKVIPIRTEIIRCCESLGLDYMGAIIWQKVTTCNTSGGATIMGSFPYPRNGILKLDYEFILLFRKPGRPPVPTDEQKAGAALTTDEWNRYFAGHWNFPGAKGSAHLAPFPLELPRRLIRMFSFPGELVLDPFLGSATTTLAARELGRRSVGYEINRAYLPLIRERLGLGEEHLFATRDVAIAETGAPAAELAVLRARLPYIFHDPLAVDRQVDPRRQRTGSRISAAAPAERQPTFRVIAVLSPDRVQLDDGRVVGLLGVVPGADREAQAVAWLRAATRGQRVTVTPDPAVPQAADDIPLVYLHLSNRKHLNAHLVKLGLATVDTSRTYRQRRRLESYQTRPPDAPG